MSLTALIDKDLDKYLPSPEKEPKALHAAMRYSVFSGGKRIRPILAVESARTCGAGKQDAIAAACAIELVHTYSLIHDDLPAMDDADRRRGRPSCHKAFGEANAILAGDALLTLAFNIIANKFDPKTGAALIKELSEAIGVNGMVGGQALDIEFRDKNKDISALSRINLLKTARLFEASTKIGAIIAGAGKRKADAMAEYGILLGSAFQIADDITDNEGYVRLCGKEKARKEATRLIEGAKRSLKIFGSKADRLKEIVELILERTR